MANRGPTGPPEARGPRHVPFVPLGETGTVLQAHFFFWKKKCELHSAAVAMKLFFFIERMTRYKMFLGNLTSVKNQ